MRADRAATSHTVPVGAPGRSLNAFVAKVDGFQVVGEAHTATEALEFAAQRAPDLILLDLYLPDADGLSVMRRLAETPGHRADVLAVTAARDITSVRTAIQLGAVNYLVKPFRFGALRERLVAYRNLHERLTELDEADQEDVDGLLGLLRGGSQAP